MNTFFDETNADPLCFRIEIAGIVAEIRALYSYAFFLCRDYLSDKEPAIQISTNEEDIRHEIQKGEVYFYTCKEFEGKEAVRNTTREINEGIIESVIIYRKIVEALLAYDTVFMHGAVIADKGRSFMFTAPSGTGKTTHIMKWIRDSKDFFILNGDKPLIRFSDTGVDACGSPWCGSENYGTNTIAPLQAIVLMERSDENRMEEISFSRAYTFLLRQTYLPDDAEKAKKTLKLLSRLDGKVRFFRFRFNNFSDDCFDISYNTLTGI